MADGATPSPRSGALLVAVGGDDAGPVYLDADEYGPCALVTGRRRSGRSGVLLTLVESALAEDWEVVVVTGRRSPLVDVAARSGGRVHGPVRRDEDAEPMLAAVHEGPFRPDPGEIDEARFWTRAEIEAALGTGVLTTAFEDEFARLREKWEDPTSWPRK